MTIVRWDPFRNMNTIQDRINRIFEEATVRFQNYDDEVSKCYWRPALISMILKRPLSLMPNCPDSPKIILL